jgi:hypothetical protein
MLRLLPVLLLTACAAFRSATEPAPPYSGPIARAQSPSDSILKRVIHQGELIVLATPVDLSSEQGLFTPQFQLGAKETWYEVKLVVDTVLKGKLKHAKQPDLGMLPAVLTPPPPFGRLAANEIVVQYPAVTSSRSDWAAAAPMILGEQAVFIFRRCYYCLPLSGIAHARGPYYRANPLVAMNAASKLSPRELPRVTQLVASERRH